MGQIQPPLIEGVRKVLRDQLEKDVREPLPERWVEQIHHLNEKEQTDQPCGAKITDADASLKTIVG